MQPIFPPGAAKAARDELPAGGPPPMDAMLDEFRQREQRRREIAALAQAESQARMQAIGDEVNNLSGRASERYQYTPNLGNYLAALGRGDTPEQFNALYPENPDRQPKNWKESTADFIGSVAAQTPDVIPMVATTATATPIGGMAVGFATEAAKSLLDDYLRGRPSSLLRAINSGALGGMGGGMAAKFVPNTARGNFIENIMRIITSEAMTDVPEETMQRFDDWLKQQEPASK